MCGHRENGQEKLRDAWQCGGRVTGAVSWERGGSAGSHPGAKTPQGEPPREVSGHKQRTAREFLLLQAGPERTLNLFVMFL